MTKAAILPFPGDPFLFCLWMAFFNDVWGNEVDRLYIVHNSPAEPAVVAFIEAQIRNNKKIEYLYFDDYIEHGEAIRRALNWVGEDLVMLVEDDGFIFKHGKVTECFNRIERGEVDIVAGERASCHPEIVAAAQRAFGTNDQPNFWPNFLFCKADDLRAAGENYGSKAWYQGDTIVPLNYVVTNEAVYSDTLVEASLKLRAMGLRVHLENQYHGMTDDRPDILNGTNIWDGKAAWCHIGSLSSGINGVLTDPTYRPLSRYHKSMPAHWEKLPEWCNTEQERLEWERRVTFWMLGWKFTGYTKDVSSIEHFVKLYEQALHRIIGEYQLSHTRIIKRMLAYEKVMGVKWT